MSEIGRTVLKKLRRLAKEQEVETRVLIDKYVRERFLYRMSLCSIGDQLVLKGGSLIQVWLCRHAGNLKRATVDIDLLSLKEDFDEVMESLRHVLSKRGSHDGVYFDLSSLKDTPGVNPRTRRLAITGYLDLGLENHPRSSVKIDIGISDSVFPDPSLEKIEPTVSGMDIPEVFIRCYPKETVIAEKYQAAVLLGKANSRMKDLYDIWILSEIFSFSGSTLQRAIEDTFNNRGTALKSPDDLFDEAYLQLKKEDWSRQLRKWDMAIEMECALQRIREFLSPVVRSSLNGEKFRSCWTGSEKGLLWMG